MKIIFKELDHQTCAQYIKRQLIDMLYLSDRISRDLDLTHGKFYTFAPIDVNEQDLYDFEAGGRVYHLKAEVGDPAKQVTNASDSIMLESLFEHLKSDPSHCICLEDYSADPSHSYIQKSSRRYYLIDNRIFYLLDNSLSSEEISTYYKLGQGYGFLGAISKITAGVKGLNIGQELPDSTKEEIFKGISAFFIEIYDGESCLIWIDTDKGKAFLDNLHSCIQRKD